MNETPKIFWGLGAQLWYFLGVPAMFMITVLFYRPLDVFDWLSMGRQLFFFNATIMTCILLVTMVLTRLSIYFLRNKLNHSWWTYIGLLFVEIVVCSAFLALFVELMNPMGYFVTLAMCLKVYFFIAIVPYVLISLGLCVAYRSDEGAPADSSLVRFQDSTKQLKLVVASDAILYINAEENYVRIHYTDAGREKDYQLRASMTGIEPVVLKAGMVRCHRSYYVNPRRVKALRKDSGGAINADLDSSSITIPVSKRAYEALSEKI